jgi:hypothetical protein
MPLQGLTDDYNKPYEVFSYPLGLAQKLIANTSSSNSMSVSGNVKAVTLTADQAIFFEHGTDSAPSANATSHYLPANTRVDIKLRNSVGTSSAYMAFLAVTVQANVYVSPRN